MGSDTSDKTLYLVDGTAQLFRAYFAIHGLTNAEGLPTNAVYGFTTMLRKLIREESPSHIGVAFDVNITPRIAWRVQPQYFLTSFSSRRQSNFSFTTGILYRFGLRAPKL